MVSTASIQSSTSSNAGWRAELALRFEPRPDRTVVARRHHLGPLRIQRPFYPEDNGTCHIYILHPPGGIVPGDNLHIQLDVAQGANVLATSPGATKFYRSNGPKQTQSIELKVAAGGFLEWFPQETIVFDGANALTDMSVELEEGAGFIGWDIQCLGRPASADYFEQGIVGTHLKLVKDGHLLNFERARFEGGSPVLQEPYGLGGYTVMGTFMAVGEPGAGVDSLREAVAGLAGDYHFALTQMRGVLVARYLGHHGWQARELFTRVWTEIRPELAGRLAVIPRIWNT